MYSLSSLFSDFRSIFREYFRSPMFYMKLYDGRNEADDNPLSELSHGLVHSRGDKSLGEIVDEPERTR